jgi:hypothetical protein
MREQQVTRDQAHSSIQFHREPFQNVFRLFRKDSRARCERSRICSRPFSSGMFLITRAASQREDRGKCLCCENELSSADESRGELARRGYSRSTKHPPRSAEVLSPQGLPSRFRLHSTSREKSSAQVQISLSSIVCFPQQTKALFLERPQSPSVVLRITMDYRVGVIRPQL